MATQINRRRTALAEIPIRMSQLRVSTDEPPVLLNRTVIDSPLDNIPIGYLTPSPSQDELIIRQRGRRRSINWSPDKIPSSAAAILSILRTPTKSTSTMTLRSSPRKRLHLDGVASSSVMLSPQSMGQSPRKIPRTPQLTTTPIQSYTPQTKRLRFTESPIAQQNQKTPLTKILKGLTQSQLINVIQELVNNEPNIETKIRTNLPMPDIKPMEEQLLQLKKNIFKSLPTSRLVKNTDSVGHSRAATHLTTFKKTVVDQAQQLNESENWDALIDYCLMAWPIVRATPIWDNKTHNSVRRSCFKILSWHCLCALKTAKHVLGEQRLKDLFNQMASMKVDCDDISACEPHLDNILDTIAI
ncbi:uncharacterized protein LOC116342107 [Contarinia nasturtii]|uniref:uncharacterized protein LOC116342107 n=1 Tax=Contarinia nasturtii TaxID=265458 RepID=UPI0012D4AD0E|nr:uncharacterized protein LOC116342107 [Contarinia nasturtii]